MTLLYWDRWWFMASLSTDRNHFHQWPSHIQSHLPYSVDPSLFDLKCGIDALTPDFDWKHVLKRMRNTAVCLKGFNINGHSITATVIKAHLISTGMSPVSADSLLAPNDKQDVILIVKLLYAISALPQTTLLFNLFTILFVFLESCTQIYSMPILTPHSHSTSSLFIWAAWRTWSSHSTIETREILSQFSLILTSWLWSRTHTSALQKLNLTTPMESSFLFS